MFCMCNEHKYLEVRWWTTVGRILRSSLRHLTLVHANYFPVKQENYQGKVIESHKALNLCLEDTDGVVRQMQDGFSMVGLLTAVFGYRRCRADYF